MALHGLPYPSMAVHALTAGLPIVEQIKEALMANAARVVDLFREFDTDGDGEVTLKEFRKAMPALGLEVPVAEVDALFKEWDKGGDGSLGYKELSKILRSSVSASGSKDLKTTTVKATGTSVMAASKFAAKLSAPGQAKKS